MSDEEYNQLQNEITRLRDFVSSSKCRCEYWGDGDWTICNRCHLLGATERPAR